MIPKPNTCFTRQLNTNIKPNTCSTRQSYTDIKPPVLNFILWISGFSKKKQINMSPQVKNRKKECMKLLFRMDRSTVVYSSRLQMVDKRE